MDHGPCVALALLPTTLRPVKELQVAREDQGAPHRPAEEEQAAQEEPIVQEEQGAKEEAQHWPAEEEAAKEEPAVQEEQGSKEEAQHWLAEEEQAAGVLTEPEVCRCLKAPFRVLQSHGCHLSRGECTLFCWVSFLFWDCFCVF